MFVHLLLTTLLMGCQACRKLHLLSSPCMYYIDSLKCNEMEETSRVFLFMWFLIKKSPTYKHCDMRLKVMNER